MARPLREGRQVHPMRTAIVSSNSRIWCSTIDRSADGALDPLPRARGRYGNGARAYGRHFAGRAQQLRNRFVCPRNE